MSNCTKCNLRFTKNKPGVKCYSCASDYHCDCAVPKIPNEIFTQIKNGSIHWVCHACKKQCLSKSIVIPDDNDSDTCDTGNLKSSITRFSLDIIKLKSQQEAFNSSLESMNLNLNKLLESAKILDDHENRIYELEKVNKELISELKYIRSKVEATDEAPRNKNLLLHGVPISDNEDTKSIVENMLLFIGVPSSVKSIINITRMRARDDNSNPPPLIIECDETPTKDKIVTAFKVKKAELQRSLTIGDIGYSDDVSNNAVFITDHLSTLNQKILRKAKEVKDKLSFKYIWAQNGKVLGRKDGNSRIIRIKSIDFIEQLVKGK